MHRLAQRQDTNLFALRRLKWGAPKRFRVAQSVDAKDVAARTQFDAQVPPAPPVTDLDQFRRWDRLFDALLWGAAIMAVVALLLVTLA